MHDKQEFNYRSRDQRRWDQLDQLSKTTEYGLQDILMNFPAFIRRRDVVRFLSHYELFKNVIDLPGCIIELGVSKGTSLLTWGHFMETFCPGDRTRKVFGFDHFQGLQGFTEKDGKIFEGDKAGKEVGGWKAPQHATEQLVDLFNEDCLVPNIERIELVDGDIFETLPKFIHEHPGLRISLLHLDLDLYEPTKFSLELLFDRVIKGGVIVFDEYGLIPWEGEANAVDEFFASRNLEPQIQKHPFTVTPSGFLVK
ncbi:MAG: TylF/MycF/NovP-related O-methyltransferase [Gammaproteobacteria bacterium]